MRLISKRQIYGNSQDRTGGSTGNFLLNCGQQQYLGADFNYKVYVQTLNIRNDFYQISSALLNNIVAISTTGAAGPYIEYTIPDGSPDYPDIVAFLQNPAGPNLTSAAYDQDNGHLTFSQGTDLWFDNSPTNSAPAYLALGMPQGLITHIPAAAAPAFSQSPLQVTTRTITNLDVMCSTLSDDRFQTSKTGLQQSQRILRLPITAAFMQRIIYSDLDGSNGTFISGARDTLDQFQVVLVDNNNIQLTPQIEWCFVLAIEVWSDVDRIQSKLLADILASTVVTNRLLQLLVVGDDLDRRQREQVVEQEQEYMEIPGLVPFGYPLPNDMHAGVRAPFNLGI
jgi:hypothetical protein